MKLILLIQYLQTEYTDQIHPPISSIHLLVVYLYQSSDHFKTQVEFL